MVVEAAFVVPLIFAIFGVAVLLLFYYHDKALLLSATQEAAVYACTGEEKSEKKIRTYLEALIKERTLLFEEVRIDIHMKEEGAVISCEAKKAEWSLVVESHMERTHPENFIRTIRKLEKIGEEVKEQSEKLYEE